MKSSFFYNFLLVVITISLFASCQETPKNLKKVLQLAGDNQKELEKVIDHYQAPEDSLKLKAAYFLITKIMPYESYFSIEDERISLLYNSLNDSLASFSGKESETNYIEREQITNRIIDRYELKNGKVSATRTQLKGDLQNISASFLIENIDLAFMAWNLPWSKKYNFQQFCRYILPYKSGKEHPNGWRKYFFNNLKFFRDSMRNETDAVVVATRLNSLMMQKKFMSLHAFYDVPYLLTGPQMYRYTLDGNCESISSIVTESMRAIGIPITEVLMNKFGDDGNNHVVNAILDSKKKWHYFNGLSQNPGEALFGYNITKAYSSSLIDAENLTKEHIEAISKLGLFGWKDITKEVMKTFDIKLTSSVNLKDNKVVYLCIFDARVAGTWVPIDWTLENGIKNEIVFKNIGGKEVVYLAMIEDANNVLKPISSPFILRSNGTLNFINPQKQNIDVLLTRKFKRVSHLEEIAKSLVGGKFEGSNSPSFKNAKIIYSIDDINDVSEVVVDIKKPATYRYYRFVYPKVEEGCYYDMAELGFGEKKDSLFIKAKGSAIASKVISKNVIKALFDSDLLSYPSIYSRKAIIKSYVNNEYTFNLPEKVWVGLDLGAPKLVSTIYYCPRNDKNGIYAGMHYELFYWKNSWASLGKKTANSGMLIYKNVPKNALFMLKNYTEGKEERIFTYENGKQVWW